MTLDYRVASLWCVCSEHATILVPSATRRGGQGLSCFLCRTSEGLSFVFCILYFGFDVRGLFLFLSVGICSQFISERSKAAVAPRTITGTVVT